MDRHSALGGHRSIASRAGLMVCALLPAGAAVGRRVMMRGEFIGYEYNRDLTFRNSKTLQSHTSLSNFLVA